MSGPAFGIAGRAVAVAAAASLAASPVLAQANAVGINAAIRNKVEIQSAATRKVRPAVLRERVILNDEVRTGNASQLNILLLDRSTFTVGANARIAIDRFVYDPAANSRAIGATVARGAFRFMSGRTKGRPSGPVSVRTPVATIGVRGTIFEGVVGKEAIAIAKREPAVGKVKANEDEASLILLRGPGPDTQGDTTPGAIDVTSGDRTVVLDRPGLAVYVPRRGVPPIGPFSLSPAGFQAFQPLLRTTAEPGGGGGKTSNGARNALLGAAGVAAAVAGGTLLGGKKKKRPSQQPTSTQQTTQRPPKQ